MRMVSEQPTPIDDVEIHELVIELRRVIDKGLPVSDESAGETLPNLRSIYARSIVPSDRRSRVSALNQLLPRLIAAMSDSEYREANQVLFGLAPGTRGTLITARRRQVAKLRNYSLPHVKDVIEAQMLEGVAIAIYNDLLRYRSRVKRSVESLEQTGDTPKIEPEHITHEEELMSRIWQHVYGLRAELIACARLSMVLGYEAQAEDHRQAAHREEADLKAIIAEYVETYGNSLIRHGETEFTAEAIVRLSKWQM
jgi:hypothetical protein